MKRALPKSILALLAAASCTLGTAATCQPASASTSALSVKVVGNHLVDGSGKVITLHGVDIAGLARGCVTAPTGTAAINAMTSSDFGVYGNAPLTSVGLYATLAAKHVNAIRIPLNEDCVLGINGVTAAWSSTAYMAVVKQIVAAAAANGIYTIVDLHLNAPGSMPALDQQAMADADHAPAFWTAVATALKGSTSVLFDAYNEPRATSIMIADSNADPWSCWLNGCTIKRWVPNMKVPVVASASSGGTSLVLSGTPSAPATTSEAAVALANLKKVSLGGNVYRVASSINASDGWHVSLNPSTPLVCSPASSCAAGAAAVLTQAVYPGGWKTAGMQSLVNAIRQTGATQPVMLGGLGWASDDSQWLSHVPVDLDGLTSLGSQLIVAAHLYPINQACGGDASSCTLTMSQIRDLWNSEIPSGLSAAYPVVMSETGDNTDTPLSTSPASDGAQAYLPKVLDYAYNHGYSMLAWSYNDWALPTPSSQFLLLAPAGLGTLASPSLKGTTTLVLTGPSVWAFAPSVDNPTPKMCISTDCSTVKSLTSTNGGATVVLGSGLLSAHTSGSVVDDGGAGYLNATVSSSEGATYFNFLAGNLP